MDPKKNLAARCPRCGCVARYLVFKAGLITCEMTLEGEAGRVVNASPGKNREHIGYRCSGGHDWEEPNEG